jgi:hypothetical protein
MKKWMQRIFRNREERASDKVKDANSTVEDVEDSLRAELDTVAMEFSAAQNHLADLVREKAPKEDIIEQARRVKQVKASMDSKRKLLGNMHREKQQLVDTSLNSRVTSAMRTSVEAQRAMLRAQCEGEEEDISDILDEIDEHREDTRDLTDRLGGMGGNDDADQMHEDDFSAEVIVAAMGWQIDANDAKLVDDIQNLIVAGPQAAYKDGGAAAEATTIVFPDAPQTQSAVRPRKANPSDAQGGGMRWNF